YDNLFSWLGANYVDIRFLFVLTSAIYFLCAYKAIIKLFPRDSFYALLAFLAAFSTFSYGTNGIRAGAASSIFLLAIAYRDRRWLSYLFLFISWGFHQSMVMPINGYFVCCFIKNPKYYTYPTEIFDYS
ncbi:MAG: EpsG family protein, partial [Helicobacter sp.]|nr:EpsG family protein [Helicobacter sp.]